MLLIDWLPPPIFFPPNGDVLSVMRLSVKEMTFLCMSNVKDSFVCSSSMIIRSSQMIILVQMAFI